jgi:hypothetical protein
MLTRRLRWDTGGEKYLSSSSRPLPKYSRNQHCPGRGYGRELIERALAYTARARTQLIFGEDGVACRIEMPLAANAS